MRLAEKFTRLLRQSLEIAMRCYNKSVITSETKNEAWNNLSSLGEGGACIYMYLLLLLCQIVFSKKPEA